MFMSRMSFCAAMTMASTTCSALAAPSSIQIDLRALTAHSLDITGAPALFGGVNHSGSLVLSSGANSSLDAIFLDGVAQGIPSGQLNSFSGVIDLGLGTVLGGSMGLILNNADSLFSQVQSGVGSVSLQPGQGFSVDGFYFNAQFGNPSAFGGASLGPLGGQALSGSFVLSGLNPIILLNGEGVDDSVNLSIILFVPTAPTGAMLAIGLVGCAARRRRG